MQPLLVIAANREIRRLVSCLASPLEVIEAEGSDEGLALAWTRRFSAILIDLNMDGLALIQRIKRDADLAHIPVIALGAGWPEFREREAYVAGCDGCIRSPFVRAELFVHLHLAGVGTRASLS